MDRAGTARWATVLLGTLTVVGALLRSWQIGDKSLWIDEAFSVWVARQPLAEAVSWLARIDQHPPLYYALLHLWLRLGDGPVAIRLLSALASTANIPLLYALGARLVGRKVGLLAAGVLAMSPFHVFLAQEARMYALLSLAVTVSLWALAWLVSEGRAAPASALGIASPGRQERLSELAMTGRAPAPGRQERPPWVALIRSRCLGARAGRGWAWAGYVVATAAALWTHNIAALYWVAANVIVLGLWAVGQGAPHVDVPGRRGVGQRGRVSPLERRWHIPMSRRAARGCRPTVAKVWGRLAVPVSVEPLPRCGRPRAGREGVAGRDALAAPPLRAWALAQGAVLFLWAPWLPGFARQSAAVYERFWLPAPTWRTVLRAVGEFLCAFLPGRIRWAPVVWAGYGALLVLGLWALRRQGGRVWFLLTAAFVPVGGAWLISAARPIFAEHALIWATIPLYLLLATGVAVLRYRSFILAAMAMLATLSLLSVRDYYTAYRKEAWDEAAAYVARQAEEGDLVLYHASWTQLPFDYYLHGYGVPVEERGVPVDLFARGVLEPQMTAGDVPALQELIAGRERVWLVYSHQWYTDPEGLVPRTLGEALTLQVRRRFYGLEVRLYGAR